MAAPSFARHDRHPGLGRRRRSGRCGSGRRSSASGSGRARARLALAFVAARSLEPAKASFLPKGTSSVVVLDVSPA